MCGWVGDGRFSLQASLELLLHRLASPPTSYLRPTSHVFPREELVTAGEVSIEKNLQSDCPVCPFRAPLSSIDEHPGEKGNLDTFTETGLKW